MQQLRDFFGDAKLMRGARCVEPYRAENFSTPHAQAMRAGRVDLINDPYLYRDMPEVDRRKDRIGARLGTGSAGQYYAGVQWEWQDLCEAVKGLGGNPQEMMRQAAARRWAQRGQG